MQKYSSKQIELKNNGIDWQQIWIKWFLLKCRPLIDTIEELGPIPIEMLTRQPDYTISELGHPVHQWPDATTCATLNKVDPKRLPTLPPSPHRLLPLRETLDDCFKRLLIRSREDLEGDPVSQQKHRKNQWNERQRKRNQKCRDNGESRANATTKITTTTLATCDLNNF